MNIPIHTSSKEYLVQIGNDALSGLAPLIREKGYTKLFVITDENVGRLHLDKLKDALAGLSQKVEYLTVPAGEEAKSFSVYESCLTYALESGLDRHSCILAFGGGAIGDLAGFTAASYMRGIPFIQVPTTILAHDSAVGGKTGINHPLGKNMVGAFHQPDAVIYDTRFLATLPEEEIRSGFAEAVKHALIGDSELLDVLMRDVTDLSALDEERLAFILQRGIQVKAAIVAQDEKESNVRAYLNFGHTLGHAVESAFGYGVYTHGEAVMIGMVYALEVSRDQLGFDFPIAGFRRWIASLGYDLVPDDRFTFSVLQPIMERDKKAVNSHPRFVLLEEIGRPVLKEVPMAKLEAIYRQLIENGR